MVQATFRDATKIEATNEVANFNQLDYQNTNPIQITLIRKLRSNLKNEATLSEKGSTL